MPPPAHTCLAASRLKPPGEHRQAAQQRPFPDTAASVAIDKSASPRLPTVYLTPPQHRYVVTPRPPHLECGHRSPSTSSRRPYPAPIAGGQSFVANRWLTLRMVSRTFSSLVSRTASHDREPSQLSPFHARAELRLGAVLPARTADRRARAPVQPRSPAPAPRRRGARRHRATARDQAIRFPPRPSRKATATGSCTPGSPPWPPTCNQARCRFVPSKQHPA